MNVKELIESLILDLANNNDIVTISRKAQVIASLWEMTTSQIGLIKNL